MLRMSFAGVVRARSSFLARMDFSSVEGFSVRHPRIYVGTECREFVSGDSNNLTRVEGI